MTKDATKRIIPDLTAPVSAPVVPSGRYTLSAKVTDKGGVSVYGLQRFPVTLYADQWNSLLAHADKIRSFLDANASVLAIKEDKADKSGKTRL